MTDRVYLDWNATAPLRPEARSAMAAALDLTGNPSSVHAEGRAARAAVERARAQVAALAGCAPHQVVFTSGATEANMLALRWASAAIYASTAHPSLIAAAQAETLGDAPAPVTADGRLDLSDAALQAWREAAVTGLPGVDAACLAFDAANGETGVLEEIAAVREALRRARRGGVAWLGHCDITQRVGRLPFAFAETGLRSAALSAHKIGGPKGAGALIHDDSLDPTPLLGGGGQEGGWRAGTENLAGIVGFGAAAEAAAREAADGAWERVAALRDRLEARIMAASDGTIRIGAEAPRLPNTSCFATPGWLGETQVIQLDLAGFAVSAGSACSSGKVRESHVLTAMGFDDATARSAIRVSIGPSTTEDEIDRFCDAWTGLYRKRRAQAA